MSFLGNIRAFAPRLSRLAGSALGVGGNPDGRWLRFSATAMTLLIIAIIAVFSANGSLFATGLNNGTSVGLTNSVSISPSPPTISPGESLQLTAKIVQSFPEAKITITVTVTGPTVTGSKTVQITTNSAGNALVSLDYPFDQFFVGTSSTSTPGTYHVTAIFVLVYPISTASTTFTVR